MATTKKKTTRRAPAKRRTTAAKATPRRRRRAPKRSALADAFSGVKAKNTVKGMAAGAAGGTAMAIVNDILADKGVQPMQQLFVGLGLAYATGAVAGYDHVSAGMAGAIAQNLIKEQNYLSDPGTDYEQYVTAAELQPYALDENGNPLQLAEADINASVLDLAENAYPSQIITY
jgi:hypothetical protein